MFARVLIGLVLCALAFASSAEEPKDKKEKETKLKPTLTLAGTHSQIRRERFEVIATEAVWKDIWELHRGKEHDPPFTERWQELNIDFDTHYVIGVFTGCDSSLVITTFSKGDAVLVRFAAHGHQTEGRFPDGKDTRTEHQKAKEAALADYCFVVLPKPVKAVIIEEDVRSDLSAPPVWKERKRFPTSKDKK